MEGGATRRRREQVVDSTYAWGLYIYIITAEAYYEATHTATWDYMSCGSVIPRLRRPRVCKHGAAFCKHDVHTCFFLLCKHELPQVLPVKYAFTQLPSCLRSISQGADLVHFRSPHVCKHNMSYLTFASRAARVCKQDTCVCKPKAHILSGVCKHKVARGYVSHLAFANAMCESI